MASQHIKCPGAYPESLRYLLGGFTSAYRFDISKNIIAPRNNRVQVDHNNLGRMFCQTLKESGRIGSQTDKEGRRQLLTLLHRLARRRPLGVVGARSPSVIHAGTRRVLVPTKSSYRERF
jgi:hypothetical protein